MPIPLPADMDSRWVADRLIRLTDSAKFTAFRWKRNGLYAGQVVGCVQLGKLRINILPKLDTPDAQRDKLFLLNILRSAGYLNLSYLSEAEVRADSIDILEAMISELAREIILGLRKGEPRRYERALEDSLVIKGRVEFSRLSTRLPGTTAIPVSHSLLSNKNTLTSIIKSIAFFLHRITNNSINRNMLSQILSRLSTTEKKEFTTQHIDRIVLSRNELHWARTLEIGRLLLSGQSPDPTFGGKNKAFSLIFPMQYLYERALRKILNTALEKGEFAVCHKKKSTYLLLDVENEKGVIGLRPDYILDKDGNSIAVADAKWKRVRETGTAHGISRDDLYQIYAYIKKYGVLNAFIFTPRAPWMPINWSKTYLDTNSTAKIHVLGIDLESLMSRARNIKTVSYSLLTQALLDHLRL